MKKIYLGFFLLLAPLHVHASITDLLVIQEKSVVVHFSTTVSAGNSLALFDLISLSTSTGLFPHLDRGEIDISEINLQVDKVSTSTGTAKVGVMTFVNTSTGSATYFYGLSYRNNVSNNGLADMDNFSPTFYRCRVNSGKTAISADKDGLTPFILSNDARTGSGLFASTNTLQSPIGFVNPRPGDIILEVSNPDVTNSINIIIDIWYHSEP